MTFGPSRRCSSPAAAACRLGRAASTSLSDTRGVRSSFVPEGGFV